MKRISLTLIPTLVFLFFCCIILSLSMDAFAFRLPDTGQTTCYNETGSIIACPLPDAPLAQDGSYSINALSYTDNGNGTITDNNTRLMWQNQADGEYYNWFEASGTYEATYNPSSRNVCEDLVLGGHSDWRLPSRTELMSTSIFEGTANFGESWTSTIFVGDPAKAWDSGFSFGYKTGWGRVRCVRGAEIDSGSFTDNHDGTVTDNADNLMWQQGEPGRMTWAQAIFYCENLNLGGYLDWRLPNFKELSSIIDDHRVFPAINTIYFPNVHADVPYISAYWSSTTYLFSKDGAYVVDFYDGSFFGGGKWGGLYVRCVRDGYSLFLDISSNHWAYDYIYAIYNAGIATGYSDGTYRPSQNVQRSQMAAFIIRAKYGENFSYSSTPYFSDVPSGHWAFKYIQKMYEEGITTGYPDGTYRPAGNVTRGQMAAFTIRGLYGESFTYNTTPYFSDVPASHEAFKYIQKVTEEGIASGYSDGTYRPSQNVNRAQMAVFIGRAFFGMK